MISNYVCSLPQPTFAMPRGVWQVPTPGDAVRLLVITASGAAAVDALIDASAFRPAMLATLREWLDVYDPPLRLLRE